MTTWKLSQDGLTATCTHENGIQENRLISLIPVDDTILPADPLTPAEQRAAIQNQINALEQEQLLPRVTREGLLEAAVALAAAQGVTEPQLYAANIGYRKTRDFDNVIVALRAQMEAIV